MRITIDSQILFIESCRFFIFDTLFQEFTFAKKKTEKFPVAPQPIATG